MEINSIMAKVQIVDVEVLDNPSNFFNPFQFQITFDCMENLRDGKIHTSFFFFFHESIHWHWARYLDAFAK